jgi:hypothetical protein
MPPPMKLDRFEEVEARKAVAADAADLLPLLVGLEDGAELVLEGKGRTGTNRESGGKEMRGSWAGTTRDRLERRSEVGSSFFFAGSASFGSPPSFAAVLEASAVFSSCEITQVPISRLQPAYWKSTHSVHSIGLFLFLLLVFGSSRCLGSRR